MTGPEGHCICGPAPAAHPRRTIPHQTTSDQYARAACAYVPARVALGSACVCRLTACTGARRHPASVTLRELYQFGESTTHSQRTMLLAAQFLHEELPVRLARRARELRKLPFGLGDTTSIKGVRKLYERSFFRLRRFPKPTNTELEERFTEMLDDIKNEHSSVQANIARGLQELSEERTDLQRQRGGTCV